MMISFCAKSVERAFGVSTEKQMSQDKTADVCGARFAAMWLARTNLGFSYRQIGYYFGRRDHSSAHNAVERAEARIARDMRYRTLVSAAENQLELWKAESEFSTDQFIARLERLMAA